MDDPQKYLDPLALAKVRGLELQARLIVEGYLSGMHKSPYHGFSVEFAQHRESVGLVTFDNQVRDFLRPSSQPSHLKQVVQILNRSAGGREKTSLGPIFHDLAERITRRSIIVILSDLFEEPGDILAGLKH